MPEQIASGYRLSPQQRRLWLLQQGRDRLAYRAECAVLIEGKLDCGTVDAALRDTVRRHQVLRTTFLTLDEDAIPVQAVGDTGVKFYGEYDVRQLSPQAQFDCVDAILRRARAMAFDLEQGPLVRYSLIKLSAERHMLLLILPALCADVIGLRNIIRETCRSYEAILNQERIPEEAIQYVTVSEWENDLFDSEDREVGSSFWRGQDVSSLASSRLPFGRQYSPRRRFDPEYFRFEIGAGRVMTGASLFCVTEPVFLLACWHIFLGRKTGRSEIIIGAGYDGRTHEELDAAPGLFAKYLPVSASLAGSVSVSNVMTRIDELSSELQEWQDWFIWELLGGTPLDGSDVPFFPFCFEYEPEPDVYIGSHTTWRIGTHYSCFERFELKLRCAGSGSSTIAELHYNGALFALREIERLSRQYKRLVESVIDQHSATIGDLDLVDDEERRQLVMDFNNTGCEHAGVKCFHALFEDQVERTPDRLAVVYEGSSITYCVLNKRANQVAHYLRRQGIESEALVPICFDWSLQMVVALLAVLKAGGAYVPLDPSHPSERLVYVLQDTQATVVLTSQDQAWKFGKQQPGKICLDGAAEDISSESQENPVNSTGVRNPAYVIYTSGSSGRPKGVMIEHRSPGNLLTGLRRAIYGYGSGTPLLVSLNAPLMFDASVQQLVVLLQGDTLQIIPEEIRADGSLLLSYLIEKGIEVFDCTPSQLDVLLGAGLLNNRLLKLRLLLVAGEPIDYRVWTDLSQMIRPAAFNLYGPTECTVDATCCPVSESSDSPSVGRPLSNYHVYLLDPGSRLAPLGSEGELSIGGVGLARGYLNQSPMTAEKFVPDPFSAVPGGRLYKTGDLGRQLLDGKIEFLGRLDSQVKLRGYRIELAEIEFVLSQLEEIRQCAVSLLEDGSGDKRIAAYVVGHHAGVPGSADIRSYLQAKLPEYMLPSVYIKLARLPLTANGKIDRRALPLPDQTACNGAISPRDSTELHLFSIWSDVLHRGDFGIDDNFFDLGGHSLTAVTLSSRVSETYGKRMSARAVFDHPTIDQMASYLRRTVAYVPPSALVPIQPRGTRRPFFCVHPAGGLAHPFIPLGRYLGSDQPFYAFQSFDVDMDRAPISTIEDLATRYLKDMRRIQPQGPYQIGGLSFGGVVAYEMAQQLCAAGEEVSVLALLDTSLPAFAVDDGRLTEDGLQVRLHETLIKYSRNRLEVAPGELESMPVQELLRLNLMREKRLGLAAGENNVLVEATEEQYYRLWRNLVANPDVARRYTPKSYCGRVVLFRGNSQSNVEEDYGWSRLALGGVEVHRFDVGHMEFVSEANAQAVAARLASCFAQADGCSKQEANGQNA